MRRLRNRRRIAMGVGVLLLMAALLAIYAVLHSPLRKPVWEALFGGCTMFCRAPRLGTEVIDAVAAVWFVGAALLAGIAVACALMRTGLERVVASGVLAYAFIVIPAAIVGYGGDRIGIALLEPPVGPLLSSVPAVAAVAIAVARGWRPSWPRGQTGVHLSPALVILAGLAIAASIVSIGFAIRYPVTGFDDMGYHGPLAVLFWQDGSLTTFLDRFSGTAVLNHPGGTELWQGLLMMIGGEQLAIAGQLPFALMGAAGVALFGRRLGLKAGAGVLAALLFLLIPIVTAQLGHLRNDIVGAALVVATAAFLSERSSDNLPNRLTLGLLGVGLIAVTKLALMPMAGALFLVALYLVWHEWRAGHRMGPVAKALAIGLVLALLAVAPWWIRNIVENGQPFYPADLPFFGGGFKGGPPPDSRYVPTPLLWPLYPLIEEYGPADGYGGAFAIGIIPGIVAAVFLARRRPLAVLALLVLLFAPIWLLLDRREPRFSLAAVALACALIPFALVALGRRWRNIAMAMLVGASALTVGAQWLLMSPDQAVERLAFYDKAWGVDPVADGLPESSGILVDDRCKDELGRLYPWFGAGQQRRVARVDCDDATAEQVLRLLKKERLEYVYLLVPVEGRAAREAALYPADRFTIVHESTFQTDDGVRARVLYRWNDAPVRTPAQEDEDTPAPEGAGD